METNTVKRIFKNLYKMFVNKEYLLFCLLGIVNTVNTSLFSSLLVYIMQENIAAALGYVCSLIIAYFFSGRIIFHHKYSKATFIKFILSYIPNYLIYNGICLITINLLEWPQFIATFVPVMIAGPITFVIIKLFAFREKGKNEQSGDGENDVRN